MSNNNNNDDVINWYCHPDLKQKIIKYDNPNFDVTQMKHPFYAGIIGAGGTGKTNMLLNLISKMSLKKGTWGHIYVVKKMQEYLYDLLGEKLKDQITFYNHIRDLPSPEDLHIDSQSLMVFDDQIAEGKATQRIIFDWFIRARKLNKFGCSCIIISQAYYPIPKPIRGQFHYIILLKIKQMRDLTAILADTGRIGVDKKRMLAMYNDATSEQLSFLKIDTEVKDDDKAFSKGFNGFYKIQ